MRAGKMGGIAVGVAGVVLLASMLEAQCPDGTPPPCALASLPRRINPPLDARTWIIVPFENVTQRPDNAWLSDASVNLLYLDLSRWHDIRVIDDERVADLVRGAPEAGGTSTLTLESAIAIAKHAGAGRLVMGDVMAMGSGVRLVGKVYDVRSGRRVRTVQQDVVQSDSIIPGFSSLARSVLDVEDLPGSGSASIGTTSIRSYQAYLRGVSFLNRWLLDSAQAQFDTSLARDSSFALAHYKAALVAGWQRPGNPESESHAAHALALGQNLPPREHALITGYADFSARRYAAACQVFSQLVAADSSDGEAWYNLGECSLHDPVVLPVAGDSSRFVFRSSWNTMRKAFQRTLQLDPTYHLAFQHIQDALTASTRPGCLLQPDHDVCAANELSFQAVLLRQGDSLLTIPANGLDSTGLGEIQRQLTEARRTHARRLNLIEARQEVLAWELAAPAEVRPLLAEFRILLWLGQLEAARALIPRIGHPDSPFETLRYAQDRFELAAKLGRGEEAAAVLDSLRLMGDTSTTTRNLLAILGSMVGRAARLGARVDTIVQAAPRWVRLYFVQAAQALSGGPADNVFEAESVLVQNLLPQGLQRALDVAASTLLWADLHARQGQWPTTMDTANANPMIAMVSFLAANDTGRYRTALSRFDSVAATRSEESDLGYGLFGAQAHLALADTIGALQYLRTFRDGSWARSSALETIGLGIAFEGMLWPRTQLLLGDLAAATGQREEAANAYRWFIAMWERGDPEVQPTVVRVREALARLKT